MQIIVRWTANSSQQQPHELVFACQSSTEFRSSAVYSA